VLRFRIIETKVGAFGLVARSQRLVATYLPMSESALRKRIRREFSDAGEDEALLPRFASDVRDYFSGKRVRLSAKIDLDNQPPYRRAVLLACRKVPFGRTATYADLARATDNPAAARAAGSAMANNPLPLVVPCHRILRTDGTLGGFSSPTGVQQKLAMLKLEGIETSTLTISKRPQPRSRKAKVA